jgi:hypothetical protein
VPEVATRNYVSLARQLNKETLVDIQNLKKLIPIIEKEKGTVHFFAVFERTRRPEHWDILLSADGLLPGRMKSIGYVILDYQVFYHLSGVQ